MRIAPWLALLGGLAVGYAAGWVAASFKQGIAPLLVFMLDNAVLPGLLLLAVGAFFAGAVVIDWLWTRLIWLWMKHKHQAEIRRQLRASAPASGPRSPSHR